MTGVSVTAEWSGELAEEPAAPPAAALAAAGVALVAAATIPGQPVGLGVFLVVVGAAGAVALSRPRELGAEAAVFGVLAVALVSMSVLRSAEWLHAVDFLAAAGLGALAVTGGPTWAEIFRAPIIVLSRVTVAFPFLVRTLGRGDRRLRRLLPALRGAALGAGLLAVFGTLFAAADGAFSKLVGELLVPDWDLSLLPARILVFGIVLLGVASLASAGTRYLRAGTGKTLDPTPRRGLGRTEWTVALGLLDLLFAAFVAVQIAVLFGGRGHVLDTAGLTYAEYAREGFFQLVAVVALTLAVVAGAVRWSRRQQPADRRLLQVLLGLLCGLTLVVLVSALRRLLLYEETFGFTRLRVSVHAAILWLAAMFILVMVAGALWNGRWLPRASVALSAVALLLFSVANPDRMVAEQNVKRYRASGAIDLAYLARLSPDALPALSRLPGSLRACALAPHAGLRDSQDSLVGWNLARQRAREELRTTPGTSPCLLPSTLPGSWY